MFIADTLKPVNHRICVSPNKATNLYRLTKAEYDHMINNAITSKYKLGHISKAILDTVNKNIREAIGLNQWRNTDTVIDWFKSIRNTHLCKFVVFDIREFYPSIMRVSSKSFHETLHRKVLFPGIWLGSPSRSSPNYWTHRYHGIVILTFYSFGWILLLCQHEILSSNQLFSSFENIWSIITLFYWALFVKRFYWPKRLYIYKWSLECIDQSLFFSGRDSVLLRSFFPILCPSFYSKAKSSLTCEIKMRCFMPFTNNKKG